MNRSQPSTAATLAAALTVIGALLSSGCAGCSSKESLGYVPHDAPMVVVVPKVSSALEHLKGLVGKFKKGLLSSALLSKPRDAIKGEFDIDLENPSSLKKHGIDPNRALVIGTSQEKMLSLIFGITDEAAFDKYVRQQVGKRLSGGATFKVKDLSGVKVTLVMLEGRESPVAAWTFAKKLVIVAGGKSGDPGAYVAKLTKLEKSIADNPGFKHVRKRIGKQDVVVYFDGGGLRGAARKESEKALQEASDWMKKYIKERQKTSDAVLSYFKGGGFGVRISANEVALRGYYAAPGEKAKQLAAILRGRGDAPDFGKVIGPDALVVGRMSLDIKKLMERALELMPTRRRKRIFRRTKWLEREHNINIDKDLLPLFAGRFAGALYAPKASALRSPPRSPAELTEALPSVLMAQISDEKKAAELLTRLERFLVMKGLDVRPKTVGKRKIYTLEIEGTPIVSWTLAKKMVVLATAKRMDPTLKLIDDGGDNVLGQVQSKAAKRALAADDGIVLNANLGKIVDLGRGFDLGMELKLMLAPVMSTLDRFKDVTLSFEVEEDGITAELAVLLDD